MSKDLAERKPDAVPVNPLMVVMGEGGIEGAQKIAKRLKDIIAKQKLFTTIGTKDHVHVEGWTTLGSMLGVVPDVLSSVRIPGDKIKGYLIENWKWNPASRKKELTEGGKFVKATLYNPKAMKVIPDADGNEIREVEEIAFESEVQIKSILGGFVLGKARSICSNMEDGKLDKPVYAIQSQSQTRATGKVFRLNFSWIMTMAGYDPTPFEDLEDHPKSGEPEIIDPSAKAPAQAAPADHTPTATEKGKKATPTPEPKEDTRPWPEQWTDVVKEANEMKLDIAAVVGKVCTEKTSKGNWKITVDHLPKLVPLLRQAIQDSKDGTAISD